MYFITVFLKVGNRLFSDPHLLTKAMTAKEPIKKRFLSIRKLFKFEHNKKIKKPSPKLGLLEEHFGLVDVVIGVLLSRRGAVPLLLLDVLLRDETEEIQNLLQPAADHPTLAGCKINSKRLSKTILRRFLYRRCPY